MARIRFSSLVHEVVAASRAQSVTSLGAIIIIAAVCASVLLTAGRTAGAQREVLRSIDSIDTRTIIVRADLAANMDSTILDRLDAIDGIEWAAAFGPAVDVTNSALSGGTRVPLRRAYTSSPGVLGIPDPGFLGNVAVARGSANAVRNLGLRDGYGGVTDEQGQSTAILGLFRPPELLAFLEPLLVNVEFDNEVGPVTTVVIVAETSAVIDADAAAVTSLLGVSDPSLFQVTTSSQTASIRDAVKGTLVRQGGRLVAAILVIGFILVATAWVGLVILKRRDFGRRRALGASQIFIALLILVQVFMSGFVGATLGSIVAALSLLVSGDPLPPASYFVAIAILSLLVSLASACFPALVAARRDPLRELRVP